MIDGFNVLITIESALSGAVVLVGRDGCYRDLASVWGTYRTIDETSAALELILSTLAEAGIVEVDWLLDKPVSNSGRLKAMIGERLARPNSWSIELVSSPDHVLIASESPAVTSDSWVLDSCGEWLDLAGEIITRHVPDAWIVDLGREDEDPR